MKKRKYRSKEDWKILIQAQSESRLTVAEFCHQQQINKNYFSQRKTDLMGHADKPEPMSSFVKIQMPTQAAQSDPIQIHYKQTHLKIPSNVSSVWLADLLRQLS